MALTEIYVDPSIAGDSGTGTIGDPYGDLEYAIEQTTFDTTNGTRINVKAGTAEVLAAKLETAMADTVTTPAWVPSGTAPMVIQGYTATAGDGGIGEIQCGGASNFGMFADDNKTFISLVDLNISDAGTDRVVGLGNDCNVIRCEVHTATGGGIYVAVRGVVSECYVHDVGARGIQVETGDVTYNYVANGSSTMTTGIWISTGTARVARNIVNVGSTTDGISIYNGTYCNNNSVYSAGGTGTGIEARANFYNIAVCNNLVEGFSGTGGIGYDFDAGGVRIYIYRGNASYNNATDNTTVTLYTVDTVDGSVEVLSASPFTDASAGNFSPVDTGNVKEGSVPQAFGNGAI